MSVFQLLAPLTYWLLIAMWAYILFFLMRRLKFRRFESNLIITLIIILAIDAFRTLFESIYFGAWYTSLSGLLPASVHAFLIRPEMVIIPKSLNVITAALIIGILLYRWFPAEKRDRELLENTIKEHTAKLEESNQQLRQEITERQRAEGRLQQAAKEWETTFSSITNLVSIHDKDFKLIRVNKAFADFFKVPAEELIGKHCYKVVHGASEPVPFCPHQRALADGKPHRAEFFEPYLGIHLEITVSPIFDEKGEVIGTVHITEDITERKKMEEQLIVTDRLASLGELTSGIAHELNNPLTGVIGFSDLLLDRDLPDDIKEDLEVINREAKRTAQVVRNLLTFARKHDTEKRPVNINSIIEKVLELRAYEQKVSNIEVNTRFAPDLPEITADSFQLQQVFINIIINAEHFMTETHQKGTLTITTELVGDIIRASFADSGPGIAKEHLGHLFDPFFTTKEVGKGTGLGLSISYGIITEHGGKIYAESELGKGATFVIELPISQ